MPKLHCKVVVEVALQLRWHEAASLGQENLSCLLLSPVSMGMVTTGQFLRDDGLEGPPVIAESDLQPTAHCEASPWQTGVKARAPIWANAQLLESVFCMIFGVLYVCVCVCVCVYTHTYINKICTQESGLRSRK